jgi:hypothetical protein
MIEGSCGIHLAEIKIRKENRPRHRMNVDDLLFLIFTPYP